MLTIWHMTDILLLLIAFTVTPVFKQIQSSMVLAKCDFCSTGAGISRVQPEGREGRGNLFSKD